MSARRILRHAVTLALCTPLALPAADTAERDALLAQYDLDGDGRVTWEELADTLAHSYPVVDTAQTLCFDDRQQISCPEPGQPWFGQDAQYTGPTPRYLDNDDGTVTDLDTGLMWQQDPGSKHSYAEAQSSAATLSLGGYDDWRLPTIKELYSLILFSGRDVSPCMANTDDCPGIPFLDTDYFAFQYGDTSAGERIIDAQYWSATEYVSTTMDGDATVFGVNFADGRIKGYPRDQRPNGSVPTEFVRYVRGNPSYGRNALVDNGDTTITDQATGLTWMQQDSGIALDWQGALDYCASSRLKGHDDWRLPNAKELQSILDYGRSPATTGSAAIDPLFQSTAIINEGGALDFPYYWTSTTHMNVVGTGDYGVYLAFGEALGYMSTPDGRIQLEDVHGAGAQRSDPKAGDPADWPEGHGPQGDVVRIYNSVRCVRSGTDGTLYTGDE